MRVLSVVLVTATLLLGAALARPQLTGGLVNNLTVALQQMLARVVCVWEEKCVAHTVSACFRDQREASEVLVAFTQCRSLVAAALYTNPGKAGEVAAGRQMERCLQNETNKGITFLDCVAQA
ncbi:uncharacterized protein LOC121874489 [Homarus americanus]|uniref:uncharacterized protein LOC121874489 n=1 Tax=Homarus americanus TaxID=6706 RepID=UPI001C448260|nr:uncharacterized protein LOC121874489 [Homarus americanus]